MAETEASQASRATAELTASFVETARAVFSAGGFAETLQRVVDLAVETIEGCDYAGILVVDDDAVSTPAASHQVVVLVDAAQHRFDEGPSFDVIGEGGSIYAEDLANDDRWAQFAPSAVSLGVRSALAYHLSENGTQAALNCYARYARAFGVIDRAKGLLLAGLSDQALAAAGALEDEGRLVRNLEAALISRGIIGRAEGILMERERVTADEAFDILRRASQHLNVKLRDVAQSLVETGERPDTGPHPSPREDPQAPLG